MTRTLDLTGFDAIMVKGHADIQFEQVPEGYEVTLRTQENVFDYLDYSVEGTMLLIQNKGKVYSIDQIYEKIWKEEAFFADNTVTVHIRHIREKIEIDPKNPKYLKVMWGIGYKIESID